MYAIFLDGSFEIIVVGVAVFSIEHFILGVAFISRTYFPVLYLLDISSL